MITQAIITSTSIDLFCNIDLNINMAIYLVKARTRKDLLDNLRNELSSGIISKMRPFGQSLQHSLENALDEVKGTLRKTKITKLQGELV